MMECLICYCVNCKTELARFSNSWDAIGTSYHSPVEAPISITGLEATGSAYGAAPDSSIEKSSLQDVACIECQTLLGLQCYSAPAGHVLKKEQLILNLSFMSVISESTSKKAKISVVNYIPLTKSSSKRPSVSGRASTAQPTRTHHQSVPPPSRPPVPLFHASAPRAASVHERSVADRVVLSPAIGIHHQSNVEKFQSWAENSIRNQQKDIDRVSGTVDRIERDMQSFKTFMEDVRAELSSNREIQEQTLADVRDLESQVTPTARPPGSRNSINIPNKRFDAITNDILLVNRKASEVDQVRTDLNKMKDRLEFLEQTTNVRGRARSTQIVPQAPISMNTDIQADEVDVPSLPKRQRGKFSSLQTPSSDPKSSSKHPSKRIRFSYQKPDDEPTNGPAFAVQNLNTPLVMHSIINPVEQPSSSQMIGHDDGPIAIENEYESIEVSRPTVTLAASRKSRRRSNLENSPSTRFREPPLSERHGSISTARNAERRISAPVTRSVTRSSQGARLAVSGTVDEPALQTKRSNLVPDSDDEASDELNQPSELYTPKDNHGLEPAEDVEITSTLDESEYSPSPTRTKASRSDHSAAELAAKPAQPDHSSPIRPAKSRLQQVLSSVEQHSASKLVTPIAVPTRIFAPASITPLPGEKRFKCGTCDERFPTFFALNYHHEHTDGCEDKSKDVTPRRSDGKPYTCGGCNKGCNSLTALNYHHQHSSTCPDDTYDEYPTCPSCGKCYRVLSSYERHVELGTCVTSSGALAIESPLLTCNACGNPYKSQSELERHQCSRVKLNSLNFREASLAAREVALVERERIVRQTLEREMMDVGR